MFIFGYMLLRLIQTENNQFAASSAGWKICAGMDEDIVIVGMMLAIELVMNDLIDPRYRCI